MREAGTADGSTTAPFAAVLARDDWAVIVGLPTVATVFVLATPWLGWWAGLTALVVYAAGFLAFVRARDAHLTYVELIRALERLPELGHTVPDGHTAATVDLAVRTGEAMGLSAADLTIVDAVAACRSVGTVGCDEPPHVRTGFDDRAVARWGHHIVAAAPRLNGVATRIGPDGDDRLVAIVEACGNYLDARRARMGRDRAIDIAVAGFDDSGEIAAALTAALDG